MERQTKGTDSYGNPVKNKEITKLVCELSKYTNDDEIVDVLLRVFGHQRIGNWANSIRSEGKPEVVGSEPSGAMFIFIVAGIVTRRMLKAFVDNAEAVKIGGTD